jgi:hypothetical protein
MNRSRRAFLLWAGLIAALWLFANWPRDGGALKPFVHWAGFPWTFAFWLNGRLEWFYWSPLLWDLGVGVAVAVTVAGGCAGSRVRDQAHNPASKPPG